MPQIDLNCDLGEGAGHDEQLMPLITSANIACGAHAGDEVTMRETVALALKHGVAIGAHPGLADRANFGRHELQLSPTEAVKLVSSQILRLRSMGPVHHVKLHGALYHMASRDAALAEAISISIAEIDPALLVYAPPGCELIRAARARGLRVCQEVFADRRYQRDGSLTPRSMPGAVIHDEREGVSHVLRMVREGVVKAFDGTELPIVAETVCVHGDGPDPVGIVERLREALKAAGLDIRAPER